MADIELTGEIEVALLVSGDLNEMLNTASTSFEVSGSLVVDSPLLAAIDVPFSVTVTQTRDVFLTESADVPFELSATMVDGGSTDIDVPIEASCSFIVGATLTGEATIGLFGSYTLLGVDVALTDSIDVPIELSGTFPITQTPSQVDVPFEASCTFSVQRILTDQITVPFTLTSALVWSGGDAGTPDSEYALTGRRRAFPLVVYAINARSAIDTSAVPVGKTFTVTRDFTETSGEFFESGAGPGYIGTKRKNASREYFTFRQPQPFEVVWFRETGATYRFEMHRQTRVWAWVPYVTVPQRALRGMELFSAFDPDGIYDYFAGILGATMSQMSIDNSVLSKFASPYTCPSSFLVALAASTDADFDESAEDATNRAMIASSASDSRQRGAPSAVALRLRHMGYKAEVFETWSRIGWACSTSTQVVKFATSNDASMVAVGFTSPGAPSGAFYFRQDFVPQPSRLEGLPSVSVPGDWVEVTVGAVTRRYYFAMVPDGAPAGSQFVAEGVGANPRAQSASAMVNLRNAINVDFPALLDDPVALYPSYITVAHAYGVQAPVLYWASRYVLIILTNLDGTPILVTPDIMAKVNRAMERVLPAAARVRSFGTGAPEQSEAVDATETLAVTVL